MTLSGLYAHSANSRVELYWYHTSASVGNINVDYALDSAGLTGWNTISSINGSLNNYAAAFSNGITPRWFRVSDTGGANYFADPAYACSSVMQDSDGWSVIPLGTGKKCIFVAAPSGTPSGSNANTGLTLSGPVSSINYAASLMSAGDHILCRRGDVIQVTASITTLPNGSSSSIMTVLGAYGSASTMKPILYFPAPGASGTGFMAIDIEHGGGASVSNVALVSLHANPGLRVDNNQTPYWLYSANPNDNILWEDLSSEEVAGGIVMQINTGTSFMATNIRVRRCVLWNGHSVDPAFTRDQAILVDRSDGILIEDCIFIDNGYTVTPGNLDQFSHNMYITEHNKSVTLRNIISIGSDNQTRPGGIYERLAVFQAPLGFTAGGQSYNYGTDVSEDAIYRDNLIDGSRDRNTALGWGFWTADGQNGMSGSTATITLKDTLINLESLDGGATVGGQRIPYLRQGTLATENQIMDNVVIPRSSTVTADYGLVHLENPPSSFRMVNCRLDAINSRPIFSEANASHPSWQLGGNTYYTARTDQANYGGWFINQNGVTGRTFAQWQSYVGDPTAGTTASIMQTSAPTYSSQRRITDYAAYIGLGASLSAFSTACKLQRKGNWDPRLTAEYAIDWIRQGYGMAPLLSSDGSVIPNYRLAFSGNQIMLDSLGRIIMVGL